VTYLDTSAGVIHGLRPSGAPAVEAGLTTLDHVQLAAGISPFIPGFGAWLDTRTFLERQAQDALRWLSEKQTIGLARQPGSIDHILKTLRDAGLGHLAHSREQDLRASIRPFATRQP
jgi:hypothetical protein